MIRSLFEVGGLEISPFGLLLVLASAAAWAQLRWGVRRLGIGDDEDVGALLLAALVGGVLGGKLYYAALYGDWRHLLSRFGLVWYGALALGTVAVLLVVRLRRLPLPRTVDAAAPTVALGYAVGRVGCFLVGDDYGLPTRLPWGVAFPYGLPGPTTAGFLRAEYGAAIPPEVPPERLVPVHPTQLYETLAALAVWALAVAWIRRGARPGTAGLAGFALLGVERFAVEFLRAKDDRFLGPFTLAQGLSLALVALAVALWLWSRGRWTGGLARPGAAEAA